MASLKDTVLRTMAGYAVQGLNGYSVLTSSADEHYFTVVSVANIKGQRFTTTSLIVHLENNTIIIEHDINNKPLVEALVEAEISRKQIILAYAGEPIPKTA